MHYHLEIIMPPTDNVEAAVEKILAPFDENGEERRHTFWDWWQIGGRYSGEHAKARVGQEKIDAFWEWAKAQRITVSGVTMGKQTIQPASQIPMIDAKWREITGESGPCWLFDHAENAMSEDICPVGAAEAVECHHVIIASPNYKDDLAAETMLCKQIWNGCTIQETDWDGTVRSALSVHAERVKRYVEKFQIRHTVRPDWIAVTVDYHS